MEDKQSVFYVWTCLSIQRAVIKLSGQIFRMLPVFLSTHIFLLNFTIFAIDIFFKYPKILHLSLSFLLSELPTASF